jgi:hypothetical protein
MLHLVAGSNQIFAKGPARQALLRVKARPSKRDPAWKREEPQGSHAPSCL